MSEAWAVILRGLRKSAGAIAAVVAAVVAFLVLRRSRAERPLERDEAGEAGRRVDAANATAKAEITAAREHERSVAAELAEINEDDDGERRRQAAIELAARVEAEGERKK